MLRAEWTKFRTVRGWVAGSVLAVLLIVLLAVLFALGSNSSCSEGAVEVACPAIPIGPDGEAVDDRFYFVHQSLTGDGALTVRVDYLDGIITYPPPDHDEIVPGVVPWAKAGIMVKESTRPGAPYAAVLLTAKHGVRMQANFTHDTPGPAGTSGARWLRLTRAGDTITGAASVDGRRWTDVSTATLDGLPKTVRIGMFVTSPGDLTVVQTSLGGSIAAVRFAQATAKFDNVSLPGPWSRDEVGDTGMKTDWERYNRPNGVVESGGAFTISGSGDIAPSLDGVKMENTLTGAPIGLIVVIVVAATFVTAEYRRGLIRTTLLATPDRGRVLAAKAAVIGAVAFAIGLVAAAIGLVVGVRLLAVNGNHVLPVPLLTEVRIAVGVGALAAVVAVAALALGALSRRGVLAVVAGIVVLVLPWMLATSGVFPTGAADWLLRLTPAAGFGVLQSVPAYAQVNHPYSAADGFYPLPALAGLTVCAAYAALALGLALVRLRRRDA